MKSYYDILGVSKTASEEDIKKAYKKLAMERHPDKNKDDPTATKKFQELQIAYETLLDKDKRKIYDFQEEKNNGLFSWIPSWLSSCTPSSWASFFAQEQSHQPYVNITKEKGKCFIVYINMYEVDNEMEDRYKNLDLKTYLNFFNERFPHSFDKWGQVFYCSGIYSLDELNDSSTINTYEKSSWKELNLPDAMSRYVIEFNLAKNSVEMMFQNHFFSELNKHIVTAREDKITREKNTWETINIIYRDFKENQENSVDRYKYKRA